MGNKLSILAGIIGVAALTAVASASSLPVTAVLYNASDTPNGVQPGTETMTVMFKDASNNTIMYSPAFVGQLNWHSAGPPANLSVGLNTQLQSILGPNGTFSTYCIEGVQDVIFGNSETWNLGVVDLSTAPTPGSPMGATKASQIGELWNRFYDKILTDNEKAAAFQLAIWEIVDDGIPTLGGVTANAFATGNFQASGDSVAINQAVTWLNAIGSGGTVTNSYTLYALSDANIQDQVFAVPNGGGNPVPLPAALPAGLALMSGLGVARFVRRRA
ncbi:MAG TPA: hypothetical protein VM008_18295 [Phycisphaerae bacterium]|nr:hypothetical protein [Phycisphaerae bacterium]